jgi:RNA polymerase sigma-B factor
VSARTQERPRGHSVARRQRVLSEVELHQRYAECRDRAARDELIIRYSDLAHRLAGRFSQRGEPADDLRQVALIGLIHAIDRYDPQAGISFVPFAIPTILGELKRHFRDRAWSMRVPRRLQEVYLDAKSAVDTLTQELGRSPTYDEMAERLGVEQETLVEALEAGRNFYALSLNVPGPSDDSGATELTPGVMDEDLHRFENRRFLSALADGLPERTRLALELRFGQGMTQSEIAREIGVSQMHVSRILSRALQYMRERAAAAVPV